MKKLALASAIALISAGANAAPALATGTIVGMTVSCASTWSGGASGMVLDTATGALSGTICLDPTGTGSPYVMLGISMGGNGVNGAIQIATDWGATTNGPAWAGYSVIDITSTPISCTTGGSP